MPELDDDLYFYCRKILLECGEFESDERLRAVFVTRDLLPFKGNLKRSSNPEERVDMFLSDFIDQRLDGERAVLPIFIKFLQKKRNDADALYVKLGQLYDKIEAAFNQQSEAANQQEQIMAYDLAQVCNFDLGELIDIFKELYYENPTGLIGIGMTCCHPDPGRNN